MNAQISYVTEIRLRRTCLAQQWDAADRWKRAGASLSWWCVNGSEHSSSNNDGYEKSPVEGFVSLLRRGFLQHDAGLLSNTVPPLSVRAQSHRICVHVIAVVGPRHMWHSCW